MEVIDLEGEMEDVLEGLAELDDVEQTQQSVDEV